MSAGTHRQEGDRPKHLEEAAEALICSLPMLFEFEQEEYPYGGLGTCFLVAFEKELYVLTALHVLKNRDLKTLRVLRSPSSKGCLVVLACWWQHPKEVPKDDPDLHDWCIVAADWPSDRSDLVKPLDLDSIPLVPLGERSAASKYLYRGYPARINKFDYDNREIHWQSLSGSATYLQPTSWGNCHTLTLDPVEDASGEYELGDLNGLSGSPVLLAEPECSVSFAGLLLRGGNSLGHVLPAATVVAALRACARERAEWIDGRPPSGPP